MKADIKTVLGRAVIKVLKPMLRVLIRNEVTVKEFNELVRQAYVDVSYEHFAIPGKKLSHNRIAVLTGLSRKEVMRLSNLRSNQGKITKPAPNRAQRVVNAWLSDQAFLTSKNKPRVLPLRGEHTSFSALVAKYSGDVTPGAVLDELVRIGVVSKDSNERIRLESIGYVPTKDDLKKIEELASSTADLLNTAVHNIETPDNPRFQRQLICTGVSKNVAEGFRKKCRRLSESHLQDLNQLLNKLLLAEKKVITDPEKREKNYRVGVGVYHVENSNSISQSSDIQEV